MGSESPWWFRIIGSLLALITLNGNGLIICLIVGRRNLRTLSNYFVLSLAVADFACGVAQLEAVFSDCSFHRSSARCVRVSSTLFYFLYASVTNLCFLTLDRYIAVLKPLRYITIITSKRILFLVIVAWGFPLLVFLAPRLALGLESQGEHIFLAFISIFQICVCFALLFATTRILHAAQRHAGQAAKLRRQLAFNHTIQPTKAFLRPEESSSAKIVGSVVAMFISCYVFDMYGHICLMGLCEEPTTISYLTPLLKLTNSTANPIAYAFFKKDIKKELKRLLRQFRCCR